MWELRESMASSKIKTRDMVILACIVFICGGFVYYYSILYSQSVEDDLLRKVPKKHPASFPLDIHPAKPFSAPKTTQSVKTGRGLPETVPSTGHKPATRPLSRPHTRPKKEYPGLSEALCRAKRETYVSKLKQRSKHAPLLPDAKAAKTNTASPRTSRRAQ
ncbi:hypothetical protein NEDG_01325 [Nematocida displodere]|uniref:Uncharacterized protein n=1 Tax=Nematocida displodere TaxID=1805483 RepID=A0A177EDL2_9MICR|nr:hypothetical protein NEDG_01325 [Nematocida displodere]